MKVKFVKDHFRNRSDAYQFLIVESSCAPEALTEFSDSQGMHGRLNFAEYSEELYALREQLKTAFWRLIRTKLTKRQREVIEYSAAGLTQTEIAEILGVNQSSITKSINGNCDYKQCAKDSDGQRAGSKRVYGGAKKKLRKSAEQDAEIQDCIQRIAEIHEEMPW